MPWLRHHKKEWMNIFLWFFFMWKNALMLCPCQTKAPSGSWTSPLFAVPTPTPCSRIRRSIIFLTSMEPLTVRALWSQRRMVDGQFKCSVQVQGIWQVVAFISTTLAVCIQIGSWQIQAGRIWTITTTQKPGHTCMDGTIWKCWIKTGKKAFIFLLWMNFYNLRETA